MFFGRWSSTSTSLPRQDSPGRQELWFCLGGSWKLTLAPAFMRSCRPRAVTLSRFGTVLVSGGRPPLALWATRDGESWTAYDIPSEHNRLVPPAQRFCPEYSRGVNDTFQQSSGYTSINVLSATSALVCYNRDNTFHFADCNKPPSQSTIFCMRVRDDGGKLTPGEHTHFSPTA